MNGAKGFIAEPYKPDAAISHLNKFMYHITFNPEDAVEGPAA